MMAFLMLFLLYVVIVTAVLGFGTVIGLALHWLVRGVDIGTAVLIGVITAAISVHYFMRLMTFLEMVPDVDGTFGKYRFLPYTPPPPPKRSARKRKTE